MKMESGTPSSSAPTHPTKTHTRKTKNSKPAPGHERCQHTWKFNNLGQHPQPAAPWRTLNFRVHCIVTQRWMKIRVPFAWFWYGEQEYGTPEVEAGTIAAANPQPPANMGPRLPRGEPAPGDVGQLPEEELQPYVPIKLRSAFSAGEELVSMRERLDMLAEQMRRQDGSIDQITRGSDTNRGGR